jgi:hypothetical protein
MLKKEQIFVAWRDPLNKSWYPVAKLSVDEQGIFNFVYTKGALKSNFPRFPRMNEVTEYKSKELFPLFYNRIISEKRPDFKNYLKWLDLNIRDFSPLKMLGLTEGIKPTDHLEFFQCPVKSGDKKYRVLFMMHGLQYFPKNIVDHVNELKIGERLFLVQDPQNPFDENAIMLRTADPIYTIGYCPRYLSRDFLELLGNNTEEIVVHVRKVNKDAPLGFRLLCEIVATWPDGFHPCGQDDFEPINNEMRFFSIENKVSDSRSHFSLY